MRRFLSLLKFLPKLAGFVVLLAIIFVMAYGIGERTGPGEVKYERPTAEGRQTVSVRSLRTTETIDAVGTVQPRRKTQVASQLLATIREVTVDAGDPVTPGQRLVVLDDREIQAQLREAEAAVAGVAADLAVREREYKRYQQMYKEKAVTKEDYDRFEGVFQVTQAQLKRAQQQAERIQVMLSYTTIAAHEAGIVADRFVDPGDLAAPGKPLLAIHDPEELELHASVRESLANRIQLGMKLRVRIDSVDLNVEGTAREIVPQAEAASRSVLVKISLPIDKSRKLYMGTFGRVSIPVGEIDRVVVAGRAVRRVGQLEVAEVVEDGTLERRFIRTGRRIGDDVEVLSGLTIGESVALPPADETGV